jgi:hypothetical protein
MNYIVDWRSVQAQLAEMPFVNQLAWMQDYVCEDTRRMNNPYVIKWAKQNACAILALHAHKERT